MAAAAYKVSLTYRDASGIKSQSMTASDVANEFWLFQSGGSEIPLSDKDAVITDILYTSGGTDTTQVALYVNGVDTGKRIFNSANLGTVYNRQIQNSPIGVRAGAVVKFKQIA